MVSNPVGDQAVRVSIALGVIDAFAVALRLLARWRSNAAFAADDALIIASLVPLFAMIVLGNLCVKAGGLGLSTAENLELGHGESRISTLLKLMMSAIVTYTLTITIVKLSILVLYRRIFSTTAFKKNTLIVGAAVMLWFIIALFTDIGQCRPFRAAFDPELMFTNQCINLQAYYWGTTASNLCIDVVMLYMPLHMVWGLKLPTRQKVALSGVFLLGGIVCIAGAMRIATIGILQKEDLSNTLIKMYVWSQVEPALAILCACLVTLRPLFVNLHLELSKFSSRFGASKGLSSLDSPDSTNLSQEHGSHFQWLGKRTYRQKDSMERSSKVVSTKTGVHFVSVDLGTAEKTAPYAKFGSWDGGKTHDQH